MAKRKGSGQPYGQKRAKVNDGGSSNLRIDTYEDVADSEDEFIDGRDKILLGESAEAKRRRQWQEQDEFLEPSDEEVLSTFDATDDDEDSEEDDASRRAGVASKKSRAGEDEEEDQLDDEDEDNEAWGTSKQDYYDADVIETEQDALDEEKEALRLQQKQLKSMSAADFGFDEEDWLGDGEDKADQDGEEDVVTEVLPQLQITDDMGPEEKLTILKSRYPEFEFLAQEFVDLQPIYEELSLTASAAETMIRNRTSGKNAIKGLQVPSKPPMAVLKYQALSAYLASLTMYFALLTSTANEGTSTITARPATELRDHPVMEGLVQCKSLWMKVKDVRVSDAVVDNLDSNELSAIEEEVEDGDTEPLTEDILNGAGKEKPQKVKKSKAQRAAEQAQAEAEARRLERMRKTEEELSALSNLTSKAVCRKVKPVKPAAVAADDDNSDFGDEAPLDAETLAEKARRRKSLRFYTSQIAQKANKRNAAGRDIGGDADIPYRERLKDRQARLLVEAEKRGKSKHGPGEELGGDSDEEDRRQAREVRDDDGSDDDDYYDMVAARSQKRKSDKKEFAEAYAKAKLEGGKVVEVDQVGADGKRKITYAIEKNKGLTPRRKKDVRNPRVKKRKKFEEKKKKLGSIRPVYKGGEGKGGYGGELTGIKKGLIRGVRL
ncbi:hypothetical protein M501DRAFT_988442 [Patellaria atrata CBS 101060]|uniref:Sas10 C-terminal domain-containing protein n=1 Tax=Patellaria atrata CBS 101060 TaxID=1346257 RepID=A0A9P4SGP4_9PEZI|nr:hypothetical protein M501DRAFT_988442 [Patellaria atrata CBS 101060]